MVIKNLEKTVNFLNDSLGITLSVEIGSYDLMQMGYAIRSFDMLSTDELMDFISKVVVPEMKEKISKKEIGIYVHQTA